jgi:Tol biopolymer transport system component
VDAEVDTTEHLHPVWSRDSQQVLYTSDASGIAQLCVIDI